MHSIVCTSPPLSRPSCGFLERESVTRSALALHRLTTFPNVSEIRARSGKTLSEFYGGDYLFACGLRARAGNFSPVPAEDELLDVIGDGLAESEEPDAHETRIRTRDHFRREMQRLHDDVAQGDLEY